MCGFKLHDKERASRAGIGAENPAIVYPTKHALRTQINRVHVHTLAEAYTDVASVTYQD